MEKLTASQLKATLNKSAERGERYHVQVFEYPIWGDMAGVGIAIEKGGLRHAVRFNSKTAKESDIGLSTDALNKMRLALLEWLGVKECATAEAKD